MRIESTLAISPCGSTKTLILVHLPHKEHWFLLIISILNLCFYIYDSTSCQPDSYKTVLETIRNKFIRNECELLSSEESALFQEKNWDKDFPNCPKEQNLLRCFYSLAC